VGSGGALRDGATVAGDGLTGARRCLRFMMRGVSKSGSCAAPAGAGRRESDGIPHWPGQEGMSLTAAAGSGIT
ncbi:hypothetical protein ACSTKT_24025, partial [Vibrio parahaemolyticus]